MEYFRSSLAPRKSEVSAMRFVLMCQKCSETRGISLSSSGNGVRGVLWTPISVFPYQLYQFSLS